MRRPFDPPLRWLWTRGAVRQTLVCPVEATPQAHPTIWVHRGIFLQEHENRRLSREIHNFLSPQIQAFSEWAAGQEEKAAIPISSARGAEPEGGGDAV